MAFFLNSFLLGIGLAMDAFSVSLANGLSEPGMPWRKSILCAFVFAAFQSIMPLIGYLLVHTALRYFSVIQSVIPWVAMLLLGAIGLHMLLTSVRKADEGECSPALTGKTLMVQGIATSIDALSVGLTIAEDTPLQALICASIVGLTTFGICLAGVHLGKTVGIRYQRPAGIAGGCILILIGLEILITSFL